jgi:hypothetical protein
MMGEAEALLAHMTGKYPTELTAILLGAFITPVPEKSAKGI